jgi:hypothetical protein
VQALYYLSKGEAHPYYSLAHYLKDFMIVIISQDEDFSAVIATQLTQELGLTCELAGSEEAARGLKSPIEAVITNENLKGKWEIPVVSVGPKAGKSALPIPLKLQDLIAQLREILQKAPSQATHIGKHYQLLPLQKELKTKASGKTVSLTDKEVQILQSLLAVKKEGMSKEALLKEIWGFDADMNTHTLETHIYRLREKFRELGEEQAIVAEGGGYALKIV